MNFLIPSQPSIDDFSSRKLCFQFGIMRNFTTLSNFFMQSYFDSLTVWACGGTNGGWINFCIRFLPQIATAKSFSRSKNSERVDGKLENKKHLQKSLERQKVNTKPKSRHAEHAFEFQLIFAISDENSRERLQMKSRNDSQVDMICFVLDEWNKIAVNPRR